jgi:M6 family metalloprotease-like protein
VRIGAIAVAAHLTLTLPAELHAQEPRDNVPVRQAYSIEDGYRTPDRATRADNGFYKEGVPKEERRPSFTLAHREKTMKVAVVLMEWKDYRHDPKHTKTAYEELLFSTGTYKIDPDGRKVFGSVNDFFLAQSYGKFRVEGRVFDWMEFEGKERQAYVDSRYSSPRIQEEALRTVRKKHGEDVLDDFNAYIFVWAGPPIGRMSVLWPMRLMLRGDRKMDTLKKDWGKIAVKVSDLFGNASGVGFIDIGLFCHELGHTFGVLDKYLGRRTMGRFCTIAYGTHGYPPSGGRRPMPLCPQCREVIGWLEPVAIDPRIPQKLALRPISFGSTECFKVLIKEDGSEYYLLENRQPEGIYTDVPSGGLLIHRVYGKKRARQATIEVQEAHGIRGKDNRKLERYSPYPQLGLDAFTPETKPSSDTGGEGKLEVRITRIRQVDGVIYFEIGGAKSEPSALSHDGRTYTLAAPKSSQETSKFRWDAAYVRPRGVPFDTMERYEFGRITKRAQARRFFWSRRGGYKYRRAGRKIFVAGVSEVIRENARGNRDVEGTILTTEKKKSPWDRGQTIGNEQEIVAPLELSGTYDDFIRDGVFLADRVAAEAVRTLAPKGDGLFLVMPNLRKALRDAPRVYSGTVGDQDASIRYVLTCGLRGFHDSGEILKQFIEATHEPFEHAGEVGPWCLLDDGCRGGTTRGETWPFHVCAAHKLSLGWVNAKDFRLETKPLAIALRAIEIFGDLARVQIGDAEWLVLENRSRAALDAEVPSEGLLVWHVRGEGAKLLNGGPLKPKQVVRVGSTEVLAVYDGAMNAFATIRRRSESTTPKKGGWKQKIVPLPAFGGMDAGAFYVVTTPPGYDPKVAYPLILDFHGGNRARDRKAISNSDQIWRHFVKRRPLIVVGVNCGPWRAWMDRTRSKAEKYESGIAYVKSVYEQIRKNYRIDPRRMYLGGFSAGSNFLCASDIQLSAGFAGSLPLCSGPPNVSCIGTGTLNRTKDHPYLIVTGEFDTRKHGPWAVFQKLEKLGANVMYYEMKYKAHSYPNTVDHLRLFEHLETMAQPDRHFDDLAVGKDAFEREEWLLASTHLLRVTGAGRSEATPLLAKIRALGKEQLKKTESMDPKKDPGATFDAWWKLYTEFYRFPKLSEVGRVNMEAMTADYNSRREGSKLTRARGQFFKAQRTHYRDVIKVDEYR